MRGRRRPTASSRPSRPPPRRSPSSGTRCASSRPRDCAALPARATPRSASRSRPGAHLVRELKAFRPHALHIATEGPLGLAMRRYCRARALPFTSSYHTRYPEYLRARWPIPSRSAMRGCGAFTAPRCAPSSRAPSLEAELGARGFAHLHRWRRGVDLRRFRPVAPHPRAGRPAAADHGVRRAARGGEEPRGVPAPRAARHQGR